MFNIITVTLTPKSPVGYPGFQRIFFSYRYWSRVNAKRRGENYFFLLVALRLVNAASPRTVSIDKKKISSGTQGTCGDEPINMTIYVCMYVRMYVCIWYTRPFEFSFMQYSCTKYSSERLLSSSGQKISQDFINSILGEIIVSILTKLICVKRRHKQCSTS